MKYQAQSSSQVKNVVVWGVVGGPQYGRGRPAISNQKKGKDTVKIPEDGKTHLGQKNSQANAGE